MEQVVCCTGSLVTCRMRDLACYLVLCVACVGCRPTAEPATRQVEAFQGVLLPLKDPLPVKSWGSVEVHGVGLGARATVDAIEAPLQEVLRELLSQSGLSFRSSLPYLHHRVTWCVEGVPLVEVLEGLLHPASVRLVWDRTHVPALCCLEDDERLSGGEIPAPDEGAVVSSAPFRLQHQEATALQAALFGGRGTSLLDKGPHRLLVGTQPEQNTLYLLGPHPLMETARRMLRDADRAEEIVEVELMTIVIARSEVGYLYEMLTLLRYLQWGLQFPPATFLSAELTYQATAAPLRLSELIRAYINKGQVDILSRTQMRVRSGATLHMQQGRTGFLVVSRFSNGVPIGFSKRIDSGEIVTLTPRLLPGGQILCSLRTETSRIQTAQVSELTGAKIKTESRTQLQVEPDSWIVVGGYEYKEDAHRLIEAPLWLRQLPLVGSLLADQSHRNVGDYILTLIRLRGQTPAQAGCLAQDEVTHTSFGSGR